MGQSLAKMAKSFLKRFLEIIGIPISILLVIIGVYGNILDYNLLNNAKVENNLLDFFIKEKKLASEKESLIVLSNVNDTVVKERDNPYHLIIVDITASVINTKFDDKCKKFVDSIFTNSEIKLKRTVKNALTYEFLRKYSQPTNQNSKFWVVLYKGDNSFIPLSESWLSSLDGSTRKFLSESMIKKINEIQSDKNKDTDITEIVNYANKHTADKEKAIITIISDFQHEKENLQINDLRKLVSSGLKKINAVYIPASNDHPSTKSLDIIKSFKNLENSSIDVFNNNITEKLLDQNFSKSNTLKFVTNVVNESSKLPSAGSQIEFYYPRKDSLGRNVINRSIDIDNEKIKDWRISSYSGKLPHIEMILENKTSYTLSNQWESFAGKVKINILDHNYSYNINNLYLETKNLNNDISRHPIIIRKYIPEIICNVCILVILILIISIVVLMLAKIVETYDNAINAVKVKIWKVMYNLLTTFVIYLVVYKVIVVFFNESFYWIVFAILCGVNLIMFLLLSNTIRRVRKQRI